MWDFLDQEKAMSETQYPAFPLQKDAKIRSLLPS